MSLRKTPCGSVSKERCEKSGSLSELKKRQHYEKPSAKRKRTDDPGTQEDASQALGREASTP
jgi:hypothetical protein